MNAPLLKRVDEFEARGALSLKPYPVEFLPRDLQQRTSELDAKYGAAKPASRGATAKSRT